MEHPDKAHKEKRAKKEVRQNLKVFIEVIFVSKGQVIKSKKSFNKGKRTNYLIVFLFINNLKCKIHEQKCCYFLPVGALLNTSIKMIQKGFITEIGGYMTGSGIKTPSNIMNYGTMRSSF